MKNQFFIFTSCIIIMMHFSLIITAQLSKREVASVDFNHSKLHVFTNGRYLQSKIRNTMNDHQDKGHENSVQYAHLNSCFDSSYPERPRLLVLTDIGGDPDDKQSLVRLLLYANEYNLEGLLATSTRNKVNPELIHERIEAYSEVLDNLRVHAEGYPSAETLHNLVKPGNPKRLIENIGEGKSTPASRHIIETVDKSDSRPIWINIWGAATDLAQALWDVRTSRDAEGVADFVSRLRVYEIAGQGDAGGWICHHFPEIFWIRSVHQFQAISVREAGPFPPDVTGANIETFTTEWVQENVQSHGALGALYADRHYKYEGDTPAFLYLLQNGLSDPMKPHYGGWGGRFNPFTTRNPAVFLKRFRNAEPAWHDFEMYTDASDTWTWGNETYRNSIHAALFRWREDFQNDFAARLDWSMTNEYGDVNHNPKAVLNGDTSKDILYLTTVSGEIVSLSAEGSSDPDENNLNYSWTYYPEPGTYGKTLTIEGTEDINASFKAPKVYAPKVIHIVLTVRDNGHPSLCSYRRVVVTVNSD